MPEHAHAETDEEPNADRHEADLKTRKGGDRSPQQRAKKRADDAAQKTHSKILRGTAPGQIIRELGLVDHVGQV